ncbi:sialate O-acetylesterase [Aristaeella hokkaidonensis]|uniref:Uncharacterized protein n=1 Tax=Aristaeella hokkaidonensis TaxID=3046382 RepID=A0AC61NJJ4_9FIRM|nr:sialate O-acetylesterase [Aristaeella hokkaidonensis]QUC66023.1 hypothetical protein JYE49_09075 [Aristaeella hokkaidonensis]SNT93751.1 sialate O-acetylesterase [Aristaeella hokkaidonensis]
MLKPASLFTDGAVLCRRKEIRVFGDVSEGLTVTVRLLSREGTLLGEGSARAEGTRFLVSLPPQEAQAGCRLVIQAGDEQAEADDVAIGEVFLAGGQSNMELELRNADEGPEIIRQYDDPLLRFFNVPKQSVQGPAQQKAVAETRWQAVSPGTGGVNSAVAYFFAAMLRERIPEIPVGIIGCYWGGTSVTCWMEEDVLRTEPEGVRYLEEYEALTAGKSMETWQEEENLFQETFGAWCSKVDEYKQSHPGAPWADIEAACGFVPWNPPAGPGSPYRPAGLAVTMVREIVPVTLTGILFYQGEEDTGKTDHYDTLLTLLIRTWRKLFRDEALPFLFVQLPMWVDQNGIDTFRWPLLRKAQAAVRDAVPGTGMICLLDQGEYGNIHPTAKRPVGERLAELAGIMLYGAGEVSPRALDLTPQGDTLSIRLSAPVQFRGETAALLEIAGADGSYVPARAEIRGDRLLLRADSIRQPVHARYAWTDYAAQVPFFGENNLPLEPFDF